MTLLLDTHIFLWVLEDSDRLKASTRQLIGAADAVLVSAASIWEVAIKSVKRQNRRRDLRAIACSFR